MLNVCVPVLSASSVQSASAFACAMRMVVPVFGSTSGTGRPNETAGLTSATRSSGGFFSVAVMESRVMELPVGALFVTVNATAEKLGSTPGGVGKADAAGGGGGGGGAAAA